MKPPKIIGRAAVPALLLMLVSPAPASPQTSTPRKKSKPAAAAPAANSETWPIISLAVEGNNIYSKEQILGVAGLKVGQIVKPADFETARLKLLATGAFQTAGYDFQRAPDGQGYTGKIKVSEETQMYPIAFEDLPASERKMRDLLKQKDPLYGERIPATKPVVDRYNAWLTEYLKSAGFQGEVQGRLTSETTPDLVILFRPSGQRPVVAELAFKNTGELAVPALQVAIASAAVGMGYTEPRMRSWLDSSVRPLYEARGRLRVSFPSIETGPAKNSKGLLVTVQVDQGEVYKLASIHTEGAEDVDRFIKPIKTGEIANFDAIKKAQENIVAQLRRRGYLHAATEVVRKLDDAKHAVSVTIVSTPGPQFTMGTLTINGLDLISEPEIRKLWGIQPGKAFNFEYPDYFLKVIRDQNLFENLGKTRAEPAVHEDTKKVDVALFFAGGREKKKDPQDTLTRP